MCAGVPSVGACTKKEYSGQVEANIPLYFAIVVHKIAG